MTNQPTNGPTDRPTKQPTNQPKFKAVFGGGSQREEGSGMAGLGDKTEEAA
jgi:hypothetical protein